MFVARCRRIPSNVKSPALKLCPVLWNTQTDNCTPIQSRDKQSVSVYLFNNFFTDFVPFDNFRYLSAVLDKNVMSKKYTESKEAQKLLETKLAEKIKECENLKRKSASLNAKMNRINTALEYFLTPNQIKLALQETKKVAWSPEEMLTAFTIKHLSKACYLFLRHKLNYPLPGISSLQRWMTMLSKDKVSPVKRRGV